MARGDELRERLEAFCASKLGRGVELVELNRLSGGASREMWSFTLDDGSTKRRLVLRCEPAGVVSSTPRGPEVELLRRAAEAGVPVPPVVWTASADELGTPGF